MREPLTREGYEQTQAKLNDLHRRLAEIEQQNDLKPDHLESVRRSYRMMMRKYMEDIKVYEAVERKVSSAIKSN